MRLLPGAKMVFSSRQLIVLALTLLLIASTVLLTDSIKVRKARRLNKMVRRVGIQFSCANRPVGYYADVDFGCRVFHICDNFGRRIPMRCPAHTLFNQIYRVCDWAANVDCEGSPNFYYVNEPNFERDTSVGSSTHSNTDSQRRRHNIDP